MNWYKTSNTKVGDFIIDGTDIGFKMINKGLAWSYKKYQSKQSKVEREKYFEAQKDAKLAVIGLWSEPDAIAPWKWKAGKRPKKISKKQKRKIIAKKRKAKPKKSRFSCGGKIFCRHMNSCSEAYFYLNKCGLGRLDRDKDGIPCESICR